MRIKNYHLAILTGLFLIPGCSYETSPKAKKDAQNWSDSVKEERINHPTCQFRQDGLGGCTQ